jgi:hypothetical protein
MQKVRTRYISCIKFISINSVTPFIVYSHKFMSIHEKLLLILVGFWIDDEKNPREVMHN